MKEILPLDRNARKICDNRSRGGSSQLEKNSSTKSVRDQNPSGDCVANVRFKISKCEYNSRCVPLGYSENH